MQRGERRVCAERREESVWREERGECVERWRVGEGWEKDGRQTIRRLGDKVVKERG